MKKTLPFKTIKKKFALVDTRPDLYLILRFLCVPLEEAHVPLVVRVPHFENHCSRELCASNFIATVWTLFYSNMTVSLCIRQESKRNDDSVSVEELDWSAESLNADLEPKTHHQTSMTCTYGIQSFHTLQNCCNRGGNTIFK